MHNKIFANDPGTTHSGYVVVEHDGREITRVLSRGKLPNEELLRQLPYNVGRSEIVVEMVASYGMAVGREVFETCVWIGRFLQLGAVLPERQPRQRCEYRAGAGGPICLRSAQPRQGNQGGAGVFLRILKGCMAGHGCGSDLAGPGNAAERSEEGMRWKTKSSRSL